MDLSPRPCLVPFEQPVRVEVGLFDRCLFVAVGGDVVWDGFALPEAKSNVNWIDQDRVFVGTDFGPGSLTSSGYPRVVKEWRRGTPLSAAVTVFEGQPDDVAAYARHDPFPGSVRDLVGRYVELFRHLGLLKRAV